MVLRIAARAPKQVGIVLAAERANEEDNESSLPISGPLSTMDVKRSVLFVTNIPTPYRNELFAHLSRYLDLSVIYRRRSETNRGWHVALDPSYRSTYATGRAKRPGVSFSMREAVGVIREARHTYADVVVVGGYDNLAVFLSLRILTWLRRAPLLLWSGSHRYSTVRNGRLAKTARRLVFRCSEGVLAYSTSAASFARAHDAERVVVVGNCHRTLTTRHLPAKLPSDQLSSGGVVNCLYVGQLTAHKGVDLLLRYAEGAASEGVTVHLVGSGPLGEVSKLPDGVLMYGWLDGSALAEAMAGADLLIFPSRTDPWGLVVGEAMASGLLVACDARSGCVPDLAEDRETAFVGLINTPVDIGDLLNRYRAADSPQRAALRERARARASRFSPDAGSKQFAASLGQLHKQIVGDSGARQRRRQI